MILTITLNPSIDISVHVTKLIPEEKLRCEQYEKEVGGGGINVAKGLNRLGLDSCALFFSAGQNGRWVEQRLADDHQRILPVNVAGETRENITIDDISSHLEYRLVNKGKKISSLDLEKFWLKLNSINTAPEFVIVSGSFPPGINTRFSKAVAQWCARKGSRLVVDLPADQLLPWFSSNPFLIKPNLAEFYQLAGRKKMTTAQVIKQARQWISQHYAQHIAISMSASGGILATDQEVVELKAPSVKVQSTVGAGDSMVAGMIYQFSKKASLRDTLRMGLACGSAATIQKGTKLFDPTNARRLYRLIK
ncbi:MAG: 1-phosphofructokinase family hexose kinase [Saprospiraceae bacterium]